MPKQEEEDILTVILIIMCDFLAPTKSNQQNFELKKATAVTVHKSPFLYKHWKVINNMNSQILSVFSKYLRYLCQASDFGHK